MIPAEIEATKKEIEGISNAERVANIVALIKERDTLQDKINGLLQAQDALEDRMVEIEYFIRYNTESVGNQKAMEEFPQKAEIAIHG